MAKTKPKKPKEVYSFRINTEVKDMLNKMAERNFRTLSGQLELIIAEAFRKKD